MGLIADILGGLRANGKPTRRTIADVEAALSRLASERTAAREAVTKAMRKRDELLLVDDTDRKIAELDAAADKARLTLERCEKAEPLLLAELAALRTEAKQARWRDLRAKYETASRDYTNVLREAVAKQGVMLSLNDEARSEGSKPRERIAETPAKGEVAVVVLKPGIELAGRPMLATGDIVALPPDQAERLLRSGAADRHQGAAA